MISGSSATILQRIIGVTLLESGEDIEVHYRNLSHENYIHLWFLKKSTLCQVLFWAPTVRQSTRQARLLFPESLPLERETDMDQVDKWDNKVTYMELKSGKTLKQDDEV